MVRVCMMALLLATPAAAGTISGVVRNGTTGKVAAGQEVILIKLQGGMEAAATTKTDAQGFYKFDLPEIGGQPMLVRVVYGNVNYHQNVPPGRSVADVEIFEPTATAKDLQVGQRVIAFQPDGASLIVGEQFTVHNHAKPPAAFAGQFEFQIPDGAELGQVSAWGPAGMPTVQGTVNMGKGRYALNFPLRPGQNGVRLSYQVAYPGNAAKVAAVSPYPADKVVLMAPPTMQVASNGFLSAGSEDGWSLSARDAVAGNAVLEVAVSGSAPPPEQAAQGGAPSGAPSAGAENAGMQVRAMPGRIDQLKWILVAGFAAVFALGAVFLWRRPQAAVAVAGGGTAPSALQAQVDHEVKGSLEEIKDLLFKLELRRQAGTITEEEYARERGRAEKVLRDLVRG